MRSPRGLSDSDSRMDFPELAEGIVDLHPQCIPTRFRRCVGIGDRLPSFCGRLRSRGGRWFPRGVSDSPTILEQEEPSEHSATSARHTGRVRTWDPIPAHTWARSLPLWFWASSVAGASQWLPWKHVFAIGCVIDDRCHDHRGLEQIGSLGAIVAAHIRVVSPGRVLDRILDELESRKADIVKR